MSLPYPLRAHHIPFIPFHPSYPIDPLKYSAIYVWYTQSIPVTHLSYRIPSHYILSINSTRIYQIRETAGACGGIPTWRRADRRHSVQAQLKRRRGSVRVCPGSEGTTVHALDGTHPQGRQARERDDHGQVS